MKDRLYHYAAKVDVERAMSGVVDGDSVWLDIDEGFRHTWTTLCRLHGINTPERGQPGFDEARKALGDMLHDLRGYPMDLIVKSNSLDKYGRPLVTIYVGTMKDDGSMEWVNVNERMVTTGHAVRYNP